MLASRGQTVRGSDLSRASLMNLPWCTVTRNTVTLYVNVFLRTCTFTQAFVIIFVLFCYLFKVKMYSINIFVYMLLFYSFLSVISPALLLSSHQSQSPDPVTFHYICSSVPVFYFIFIYSVHVPTLSPSHLPDCLMYHPVFTFQPFFLFLVCLFLTTAFFACLPLLA